MLWFHGRCHIEQIDVRLLNRTQDRNDVHVSTWNLVQMMLHRHRYTTLFSWNFKYLFQIWITVKSNMIGRFIVAMVTNSKHWRHDYVCYVTKYLCPKFDIDGLFNFSIRDVSVFSQSEALLCYHGNKCVTESIFKRLDITNNDNVIKSLLINICQINVKHQTRF